MQATLGIINPKAIDVNPLRGKVVVPVPFTLGSGPQRAGDGMDVDGLSEGVQPEPFLQPSTFKLAEGADSMDITDMDAEQFLFWTRRMSTDMNEHPGWRMNLRARAESPYPQAYVDRQIKRGVDPEVMGGMRYLSAASYLLVRPEEGVNFQLRPELNFDKMQGSLDVFLNGVGMTIKNQGKRTVYQDSYNMVMNGPTIFKLFGKDLVQGQEAGHATEQTARIIFAEHFGEQPEFFQNVTTKITDAENLSEEDARLGVISKTELTAKVMGVPKTLVVIKTVAAGAEGGTLFDVIVYNPLIVNAGGDSKHFPVQGRLAGLLAQNAMTRSDATRGDES